MSTTAAERRAAPALRKVAIVCARSTAQADGIRDYSERLLATLRGEGLADAKMFLRAPDAFATRLDPRDRVGDWDLSTADAVVLQYNPFWYGRRGFAPGLVLALRHVRRAAPAATVTLMVHENYIDATSVKWALMSAWQRSQLKALQVQSDLQLCTIEAWTDRLRRSHRGAPAYHLPVGSNFDDHRSSRAASRREMNLSDDAVLLCTFGLGHPGRLTDLMIRAATAAGDVAPEVVLLNLGTGTRAHERLSERVTIVSPGYLDGESAARRLAGADVFLAAFQDGISTRRTTLMSALQHQVAVVGTSGHLTDKMLHEERAALALAPVSEPDAFVNAVVDLVRDTAKRRRIGDAGRALYERTFDWPVIAARMLELIERERA